MKNFSVQNIDAILANINNDDVYLVDVNSNIWVTKNQLNFNGDIIIVGINYILNNKNDLSKAEYGNKMEVFGFTDFICAGINIYQDDNKFIVTDKFNYYGGEDDGKVIGKFIVNGFLGRFGIFLLSEVLKVNPDFKTINYINEGIACVVKDFHGTVSIMESTDWLYIVGEGNKNFYSTIYSQID